MASITKSYKEYYRRLLFMEGERDKFFKELSKVISLYEMEKVDTLLGVLKAEGHTRALAQYSENDGESLLHIAAKFNNESSKIIRSLIKLCPELLTVARKQSENYRGQTALHIAIAKGNIEAVETMLSEILKLSQSVKTAMLHQLATGDKFPNTIMMGELPLSIAALTFREKMVDVLLKNGAEMEKQNNKGDTVFHTLIRFAAIYPEKTTSVISMMDFLHDEIKERLVAKGTNVLSMEYDHSDLSYIWFIPNNEDHNALQLAASLSQAAIFQFIINLPKVYCFLNNHDGLFDWKLYDITEIDSIATSMWTNSELKRRKRMSRHIAPIVAEGVSKHKFSNKSSECFPYDACKKTRKSILETMFDIKNLAAFEFIQQPILRQVIKSKWQFYSKFYFIWMVVHLVTMTTLTVYSVLKADNYPVPDISSLTSTAATTSNGHSEENYSLFLTVYSIIQFIIALLYFVLLVIFSINVFIIKSSLNLVWITNVLHNGLYMFVLLLFSLSLIFEFILDKIISNYENYTLIVALITGWWFTVFFLRAYKKFSFFTVMIQKIIFGDILRFSVIIGLMLIAFTAGVYMTFKGAHVEETQLHSYGTTMMLLFKLMLGLGDIEDLYQARRPWMAVTLFIVFVILTYVLMFNALIAMMSQTCTLVSENRLVQWRVQQLSVITFFEDVFPLCLQKLVGKEKHVKRFDPKMRQIVEEKRYFLDLRSIQTEYANAEDIYAMKHNLQTLPFGEQRQTFEPDFQLTIPTHQFMRSPRYNHPARFTQINHLESPTRSNTAVQITQSDEEYQNNSFETSPKLKRRKSKRDKSPKTLNEEAVKIDDQNPVRKSKRKTKKKRDGANDKSFDDNVPNGGYHLDQEYLTVPVTHVQPSAFSGRRQYSENNLVDTHIAAGVGHYPVRHVQFPVQQHSKVAPAPGQLDIGVISDSYM